MLNSALWAILHNAFGTGANKQLLLLLEKNPKVEELWGLDKDGWQNILPGLSDKIATRLSSIIKEADSDKTHDFMSKRNIKMISYVDEEYPQSLKNIDNPPPFLYTIGNYEPNCLRIGMVGSRKCSEYGKRAAFEISRDLSANGVCVVSGMARGIDASSHSGAIEAQGGTVAVLGTGVDVCYPRENRELYNAILKHERGLIISEFPLASKPLAFHFPLRNRIISGLCEGLVVVEASPKSGALITATLALEQGKDVFAVPGSIFSEQSVGCLHLLKDGASIASSASDILEEYGQKCTLIEIEKNSANLSLSKDEKKVLELITIDEIAVDEIAYLAKMPIGQLMGILSVLEIEGLVKSLAGRKYMRIG